MDKIIRREYRVVSVPDQRQVELIRNLVTLKVSKYVLPSRDFQYKFDGLKLVAQ